MVELTDRPDRRPGPGLTLRRTPQCRTSPAELLHLLLAVVAIIAACGDSEPVSLDAPAGTATERNDNAQEHRDTTSTSSASIDPFTAVSGTEPGPFLAVSVALSHFCGLHESGAIECWGSGRDGQNDAPTGDYTASSGGGSHTCALRESGAMRCWGPNDDHGEASALVGRFRAVSAGAHHTCGLRGNGKIACWGSNHHGQSDAPTGRFTAVSAGTAYTCAIRDTGEIECWGNNLTGQLDAPAP